MGKPQERPFGPQLARPHGGDRQDVLQDFQPVCGLPGTGGQFPDSEFLGGDYDGPRPLSLTKTNTWPPPPRSKHARPPADAGASDADSDNAAEEDSTPKPAYITRPSPQSLPPLTTPTTTAAAGHLN